MRGVLKFKICEEPESPNQGVCLRHVLNRNCPVTQWGGGGGEVFKIYDDSDLPNGGGRAQDTC